MSAVTSARTAVTLAALVVLVVVMAVFGWHRLFAPLPDRASAQGATACQNEKRQTSISSKQVTVSVYNATTRKGLADRTMNALEARDFGVGSIGNAPEGSSVTGVEVRTPDANSYSAKLVAQQFKPVAKVAVSEDQLGPGVDVILGTGAKKPKGNGPTKIKLDKPIVTCLDNQGQ